MLLSSNTQLLLYIISQFLLEGHSPVLTVLMDELNLINVALLQQPSTFSILLKGQEGHSLSLTVWVTHGHLIGPAGQLFVHYFATDVQSHL